MPGAGCIYESQQLSFIRPVYYGDVITTRITIVRMDINRNRVTLKTECHNQNDELDLEPWGMYVGIPVRRIKERSKQLLTLAEQFEQECAGVLGRDGS